MEKLASWATWVAIETGWVGPTKQALVYVSTITKHCYSKNLYFLEKYMCNITKLQYNGLWKFPKSSNSFRQLFTYLMLRLVRWKEFTRYSSGGQGSPCTLRYGYITEEPYKNKLFLGFKDQWFPHYVRQRDETNYLKETPLS